MSDLFFIASAPSKILLFGEHAVVYGKSAIAAAADLRTFASCQISSTSPGSIYLHLPDLDVKNAIHLDWQKHIVDALPSKSFPMSDEESRDAIRILSEAPHCLSLFSSGSLQNSIKAFVAILLQSASPLLSNVSLTFKVASVVPLGAGMGSSASYAVTLAALIHRIHHALSQNCETEYELNREQINSWAFTAEKIIHGTPSGVDNAVSTHGGALEFRKPNHMNVMQKKESILQKMRLLVVNTKQGRSTKDLVAGVRVRRDAMPQIMDPILDSIDQIGKECVRIMEQDGEVDLKQDYERICTLVEMNHGLLNAIGVGHEKLEIVRRVTKKHGMFCKLTGAGGGGCAIVVLPLERNDQLEEELKKELREKEQMEVFEAKIGCPGVSIGGVDVPSILKSKLGMNE